MEGKEQAEKLFIKNFENEEALNGETQSQLDKTIKRLLRDTLSIVNKGYRFRFKDFEVVIQKTAEKGKFIPEKAAEAFKNLGKYFILIYKQPWKKEFRKIMTYCGFFQSKIKAHLEDPESIICLVGFQPERAGTLALATEADPQLLLSVAFECVVATVECEIISEFHRRMKENGATVADVVRWRETGVMPDTRPTCNEKANSVSKGLVNSIFVDSAYGSTSPSAGNVPNKSVVAGAEGGLPRNLPYIDEDDHGVDDTGYVEGTVDEHLMASLKRLSQTEYPRKQVVTQGPMEDWAYVRDGLKNKYGEGYYDGARGDVIRMPRENIRVGNNDDLSDEGIDIEEEPPAVNIQNPPVRIVHRSLVSNDRTRDSAYRTGSSSTHVYYPPGNTVSGRGYQQQPTSPGIPPVDTSAYVSQSSYRTPQVPPIVARGVTGSSGYSSVDRMAKKSNILQLENFKSSPYSTRSGTSELMARNMRDLGLPVRAEWACTYCTLRNNKQNMVCNGCDKSRDPGPEVDGPQCGDCITVCKECTFENQPGAKVCSMCGYPLDKSNVHTFV